jgi:TetR/AcrR family transcriptional repressor of bet genes
MELAAAFARVLATHGQAGATIAALAAEANVTPGLVHHYFRDKQDLYGQLLELLIATFRGRTSAVGAGEDPVVAYGDAALALDERADLVAARAWVGLFAAAMTDPTLFSRVRRLLDGEVQRIERRGRGRLSTQDASALLAFVVGSLLFGAFAPRKAAGFAAPAFRRMLEALRNPSIV